MRYSFFSLDGILNNLWNMYLPIKLSTAKLTQEESLNKISCIFNLNNFKVLDPSEIVIEHNEKVRILTPDCILYRRHNKQDLYIIFEHKGDSNGRGLWRSAKALLVYLLTGCYVFKEAEILVGFGTYNKGRLLGVIGLVTRINNDITLKMKVGKYNIWYYNSLENIAKAIECLLENNISIKRNLLLILTGQISYF